MGDFAEDENTCICSASDRMSNVKLSKIEDCNEKEDMLIRLSGRATPEPRVKV